ncbi:MAG TPA: C69 family dipeptidase, partial [Gemmataceae bacterium]|nr:C69 family dipeptidase [Gemmataceae bacterium]
MGGDLVVALGPATVHGQTLFGLNCHRPPRECQTLCRVPGRAFALGEIVKTAHLELPQARQTCTVLAGQAHGAWGYQYGVNEHQVAAGYSTWRSRFIDDMAGLHGPELVRLILERAASARQAVDLLTDLVARHGQNGNDHIFLIADPSEAFVVEAAGNAWATQEIQQVRAVSDVAVIRQDWDHIAPGLSERAVARGWCPADGNKLDFIGTFSTDPTGPASALRRWGRATYLLEQQNGHIDPAFLRRLLADHYEGTRYEVDPPTASGRVTPLCRHATPLSRSATGASFVAILSSDPALVPVAWCAFGPPCISVHFPILLDGDLPASFGWGASEFNPESLWWQTQQLFDSLGADSLRWDLVRDTLDRLQSRMEQEVEEFTAEAAVVPLAGSHRREELRRLASSLMQSHLERFEEVLQRLLTP